MEFKIAQKISLTAYTSGLTFIFGFVSLYFVKAYLGFEALGILSFALAFTSIFRVFGDLGYGSAHIKRTGEGLDLAKCHGTLITIKTILTFFMISLMIFWVLVQKYVFGYEFESRTLELVVYLIIFQQLFVNISSIFDSIFAAKLEIAKVRVTKVTTRFIVMCFKIAVCVFGFSVIELAYSEILGSIVFFLMCLYLFRNESVKLPDWNFVKNYSSFAYPIFVLGLIGALIYSMDKLMIGYFVGTTEVGYYALPERLTNPLLIFGSLVTTIFFVTINKLYVSGDFLTIIEQTKKAEKYVSMLSFPLLLIICIFPGELLSVFGPDSFKSEVIFPILALSTYIMSVNGLYLVQISSTGHLKQTAQISIFVIIILFCLNCIMIPNSLYGFDMLGMGAKGAALGTLIGVIIRGFLARYVSYKIIGNKINKNLVIQSLVAIFLYFSLTFFYNFFLGGIYLLLLFLVLIPVSFFSLLYLLGEFNKQDIIFFYNNLRIGPMKKYVSHELKN